MQKQQKVSLTHSFEPVDLSGMMKLSTGGFIHCRTLAMYDDVGEPDTAPLPVQYEETPYFALSVLIPYESINNTKNIGSYPVRSKAQLSTQHDLWQKEVNSELVALARDVYAKCPFEFSMYGLLDLQEILNVADALKGSQVADFSMSFGVGVLTIDNGILKHHPPKDYQSPITIGS